MKKKYKTLTKRLATLTLTALIVFSSVFSSYSMTANAEENSFLDNLLVTIVENGSIAIGSVAGNAIGEFIVPGGGQAGSAVGSVLGGAVGSSLAGSLLNAKQNWYADVTDSGQSTINSSGHGGGGKTINYQKRTGVSTPQNSTTYNKTQNMSLYNETKTWNNTTNKYDYSYNWYNPITNKYDITNTYKYNTTYNTYNYETYNIDVTNNYNYTTNYYIQDNRTYVSYYIINTCEQTGEEENTYVEMYYQLPDGRNSLDLTVDDIKGMYFPSNYSKYISVAEDDGTTLGLWHLDGDLKDSSYWGNTSGSSYQNVYTDGLYSNGKKFSDSVNDFIELKLDKVSLPDTWTLEWCEYVPNSPSLSPTSISANSNASITGYNRDEVKYFDYYKNDYHFCYFDDVSHDVDLGEISFNNLFTFGNSSFYAPSAGSFVPYALVYDGTNYKFYLNGVLQSSYEFAQDAIKTTVNRLTLPYDLNSVRLPNGSVSVTSESIKFSTPLNQTYRDDVNYVGFNSENGQVGSVYRNYHFYMAHPIYTAYSSAHKNAIIDEVRLSSGVLYSGSSYTPQSQPYTTNTVLAVPSNPEKHEIAFKTNTNISDVRFGGARPTYPSNGYVYVALDSSHKVESIQQYQEDGWYEIDSAVYLGTDWVDYKGFDMDYLGIDSSDTDTGGDTGGGSDTNNPDDGNGGSGTDNPDDSGGTGVGDIIDGIGKFFDTLLSLIGKIIGLVSDFVNSALSLFETLTVFTDGFSQFLSSAFGFLPPEAITVIVSGITTIVLLAIIKYLRG